MRRLPRLLACALSAAVGLVWQATPAAAEPGRTSSLGWVRMPGAEECIGTRELAQAVEQRLGRAVFVPPVQAEVFLEGRVEPVSPGQGFRVRLALSDERGAILGVRNLEVPAGGCRALDEPLALVLALLIDPDAALAAPGPSRALPPPPPRVVVERVLVPVIVPYEPPKAPSPWRESLGAGAAFSAGLLPGVGAGFAVRGELTPPRFFSIELGGTVWLDARAETPAAAGVASGKGATLSLSYGTLALCPLGWSAGGTRVRGCAGAEAGALRAVGYGIARPSAQEQAVGQALVEGRVTQRLVGPLELSFGLGLLVPFTRARVFYTVDPAAASAQEVFRVSAVAGAADLGLGLAFP